MIGFIDDRRDAHGRSAGNALPARRVEPICKVLPIAPSTYRAHAATRRDPAKGSARARRDAVGSSIRSSLIYSSLIYKERLAAYPGLTAVRLWRDLRLKKKLDAQIARLEADPTASPVVELDAIERRMGEQRWETAPPRRDRSTAGIVDCCTIFLCRERRSCSACVWDAGDVATKSAAVRRSSSACLRSPLHGLAARSASRRLSGRSGMLPEVCQAKGCWRASPCQSATMRSCAA
jgi:hypothetical protein